MIVEAFDDGSTPYINDPLDEKLKYCSREYIVNYAALVKCHQSCKGKACDKKGQVCDAETDIPVRRVLPVGLHSPSFRPPPTPSARAGVAVK